MKKSPLRRTKGIKKQSEKNKRLNQVYCRLRFYLIANRAKDCCEYCGKRGILHCHHIRFRSHGREDSKENLIILCVSCHTQVHENKISKEELFSIVQGRNEKYGITEVP